MFTGLVRMHCGWCKCRDKPSDSMGKERGRCDEADDYEAWVGHAIETTGMDYEVVGFKEADGGVVPPEFEDGGPARFEVEEFDAACGKGGEIGGDPLANLTLDIVARGEPDWQSVLGGSVHRQKGV